MIDLKEYWNTRYQQQGYRTVGNMDFTEEKLMKKTERIAKEFKEYFKIFEGRRILDFGCGHGRLSKILNENGVEDLYGVDIVDWALAAAQVRVPAGKFSKFNGEYLDFESGFFGGVLSWTVLQHIPPAEVKKVANEIQRVLGSVGVLVLYENMSKKKDAKHIWFRSLDDYIQLFHELELVKFVMVDNFDDNDEMHGLMVMARRGWF